MPSVESLSERNPAPIRLRIEGMTCGSCVARVERALSSVSGVVQVRVNLTTEVATIDPGADPPSSFDLIKAVRAGGYDAGVFRTGDGTLSGLDRTQAARLREQRQALLHACGLGLPILVLHWLSPVLQSAEVGGHLWPVVIQAILCAVLLGSVAGAPILVGGLRAMIHRTPNMDLLISMGVSVAFGAGLAALIAVAKQPTYFHAVAMILVFINLGRYLEALAKRRAADAVSTLVRRMPVTAQLVTDDGVRETRVELIKVGMRVRIAQDTIIPVDGRVDVGLAEIDESTITGEAMPRRRRTGDTVCAGAIVRDGMLTVEATRVGTDSTIGRIIRAVEEAQSGKTKLQRIADRVAGVFVPIVILLAVATLAGTVVFLAVPWSTAINRAVAVLVIACPCAMGLATPMAVLVATGSAALQGILVRDAAALEAAGQINSMLIDKTGTLTIGRPAISEVFVAPGGPEGFDAERLVLLAASAEQFSQHPLARVIVVHARSKGITLSDPTSFTSQAGSGVRAELNEGVVLVGSPSFLENSAVNVSPIEERLGQLTAKRHSVVAVAVDGRCCGLIGFSDSIRPGAREALDAIRARGIAVAMLTGDHQRTADTVGAALGITQVLAELMPEEKLAEVRRRCDAGEGVAFVGDGINDAPALAAADVGITFSSATDAATDAADITILHDDLRSLPVVMELGRRSVRVIKQNLFWAFFYNISAIPLAALGKIPPGYAAAAMMISSICVVLNSLRLRGSGRH